MVCISDPNSSSFITEIVLNNCDIVLTQDQEIRLHNLIRLKLTGTTSITLKDNAKISGQNHHGSQLLKTESGPAIFMKECDGCEVSDLSISGGVPFDDIVGIDSISDNNTISAVKFENLGSGMIVTGSNNSFLDLHFLGVSADSDCDPLTNTSSAVKLDGANLNSFTNILHRESPGAITLWLENKCDGNIVMNLSIEQEDSNCPTNHGGDPTLFINDYSSANNVITANFNGGRVELSGNTLQQTTFCTNNTILNAGTFADCTGGTGTSCN